MDALGRGVENRVDPANVPGELYELAQLMAGRPAWEGHSAAQELHERRVAERRRRREVPEWFSAQDVVWKPWEREAVTVA